MASKTNNSPIFKDALLNQLDLLQYALIDFNQTGSMVAIERLNDSIFNFNSLYFGRMESNAESADLATFTTYVFELTTETRVLDTFLKHLVASSSAVLLGRINADRERSLTALTKACEYFESQPVISNMRNYLRTLSAETEAEYHEYCKKCTAKLLARFKARYKRLKNKRTAMRYNDFVAILTDIHLHMELLDCFVAAENPQELRQELKKHLDELEDYSYRLNLKVMLKAYRKELLARDTEADSRALYELSTIPSPKAGRKELKKLMACIKQIIKDLVA
jgi:hypothetical protein